MKILDRGDYRDVVLQANQCEAVAALGTFSVEAIVDEKTKEPKAWIIRAGIVQAQHLWCFDSEADAIELCHTLNEAGAPLRRLADGMFRGLVSRTLL